MRPRRLLMAAVAALLCCAEPLFGRAPGAQGSQGTKTLPMPCLQMVDERAVTAVLGDGFSLRGASFSRTGQSSCQWQDARTTPSRLLGISFTDARGFPPAAPTAAGAFDATIAQLTKAGVAGEPVAGLGEQAMVFTLGEGRIFQIRRADGLLTVTVINLSRDQGLAVARRAVAAPSPALGTHATFPEPTPVAAATPMTVEASMRNWPCMRLLTIADVRSVKRDEVLVEATRPRPGYSACVWRTTTADTSGFRLAVITREEFAGARAANAAEYLAAERKLMSFVQFAPVPGLGDEAVISSGPHPVVLVRKQAEVMQLGCDECTRDQIIALARVAAAKLGTAGAVLDKLRTEAAKGSPLPCLQLLDARAVKAVLGTDLEPVAIPVLSGESNCSWWTAQEQAAMIPFSLAFVDQRAFLNKIMFPSAAPSATGIYDFEVGYRRQGGMKAEPIGAIGRHATAFAVDQGTVLLVLRADGVIRINSTLPREQLRALATRAANAPPPVLGRHVSFPEPGELREAVSQAQDPAVRNVPCVQMLTEAEVQTAKRTEVLVDVVHRPGYSLCEWRGTSAYNTGFMVAVTTATEFKVRGFAGASSYFAAEKKAMTTAFKPEVLYGLGNDAIQAEQSRQGVAMVRTGETVVTVTCFECNRFDAIVLARLAAVVK